MRNLWICERGTRRHFESAHITSWMMALGVHGDRIKFMLLAHCIASTNVVVGDALSLLVNLDMPSAIFKITTIPE